MMSDTIKFNYGLVLSGGGARGLAHIGVYKALSESGKEIEVISGTSMGAVIGALIAAGYSATEIEEIAVDKVKSKLFEINAPKLSLASHKPVRKILSELLPEKIEDLEIPLYLSSTNLTTGENEILSKGNLYDAVMASTSIPIAFKPIKIKNDYHVDGGLTNNLPASYIRDKCKFLIGSHVNHKYEHVELKTMKDILDRCIRIGIYNSVREEMKLCDLFIDPPKVREFQTLDFKQVPTIINIGYEAALEALELNKI